MSLKLEVRKGLRPNGIKVGGALANGHRATVSVTARGSVIVDFGQSDKYYILTIPSLIQAAFEMQFPAERFDGVDELPNN
jgi:hypothetical protein